MDETNACDALNALVEQKLPDDWKHMGVEELVTHQVRSYLDDVLVANHSLDAIAAAAVDAIDLPTIGNDQISLAIYKMFSTNHAVQDIVKDPAKFFASDDPRRKLAAELRQIRQSLNGRISDTQGVTLRERRSEILGILHDTLTEEEFISVIRMPDLYRQSPDIFRRIAQDYYVRILAATPEEKAEKLSSIDQAIGEIPAEALATLTQHVRRESWEYNKELRTVQIRKAMMKLLPSVGTGTSETPEGGAPDKPAFWNKVETHYLKKIGDTSPGNETLE